MEIVKFHFKFMKSDFSFNNVSIISKFYQLILITFSSEGCLKSFI